MTQSRQLPALEPSRGLVARGSLPVDGASLAFFRIALGATLFVAALRYFWNDWVDALFHAPTFFFTYSGFEWVTPWPRPFMHVHFALMALAGLCISAGAFYRVATASYLVLFTYAHLIDKALYLNHYYLASLVLLLMCFFPLHAAFSVDAWRARRSGRAPPPAPCAYMLWSLRAQFGLVYFFGGVAKLGADWLVEGQPLRMWLSASGELPIIGSLLREPATAHVFAWAGLLFDLLVPFSLSSARSRRWAFGVVLVFHASTALLFPIGIFPWVMTVAATLFFAPDWPRYWMAKLRSKTSQVRPTLQAADAGRWAAARAALVVWFAVQVALPLRTLWGPPDLHWHESGFRFGWRVMVMEKTAVARFEVQVRGTRPRTLWVEPKDLLTPLQARQMSTQPDMLVQFARHLARREAERTGAAVSVRAHVLASLNGGPALPLLDPRADLAAPPLRPAHDYVLPRPRRR